jgi:hypothetical protein
VKFLIDENVPSSVARFLVDRGHEVIHALDLFLPGEKDEVLASVADREEAIVVTWNAKDFRAITTRRAPKGTRATLRKLGWICFRCKEPRGRGRLEDCMDLVEFEYERAQSHKDARVFIEIAENSVKILR